MKYILDCAIFITALFLIENCQGETSDNCQNGAIKPNMKSCSEFYMCREGIWQTIPCPPYSYFNKIKSICMPDNGSCLNVRTTPKPGCVSGTIRPDINDCTKYMICVLEKWRYLECPNHLYFNVTQNACVIDDGTCVKVKPTEKPNDTQECLNGLRDAVENNCNHYLLCENGIWETKMCSSSQYFNSKLKECVLDNGACYQTTQPVNCFSGTIKEDPLNCSKYYSCKNGYWSSVSCSAGFYFNIDHYQCLPHNGLHVCNQTIAENALPVLRCSQGDIKEDENDCENFYFCKGGNWSSLKCPSNFYFNFTYRICIPDDGSCNKTKKTINTPTSHCSNGDIIEHESDCSKYYFCKDGNWTSATCPLNFDYSFKYGICLPGNGTCDKANSNLPLPNCINGDKKRNEKNCAKYFLCKNEKWSPAICPSGFYFNSESSICVINNGACRQTTTPSATSQATTLVPLIKSCTHGVLKLDINNCYKYYFCKHGNWSSASCPSNFYFNSTYRQCLPNDGSCNNTISSFIPLNINCSNGVYKNHENDCHKYYLCENGNWSPKVCPNNMYFNLTDLECTRNDGSCNQLIVIERPSNINCSAGSIKEDKADCSKYLVCKKGKWSSKTCPAGFYFNSTICIFDNGICDKTISISEPTTEVCVNQTVIPDVENCLTFWECKSNIWIQKSCPNHYYFNVDQEMCLIDDGKCNNTEINDTNNICEHGSVKAFPFECKNYLYCKSGKWIKLSCAIGFHYDSEKKVCVSGNDCTDNKIESVDMHICQDQLIIDNIHNCTQFYHCVFNRWFLYSCPDQYYFNTNLNQCIPNDGACCVDGLYMKDKENVNKFFICKSGIWEHKQCPLYHKFDIKEKWCVFNTNKNN